MHIIDSENKDKTSIIATYHNNDAKIWQKYTKRIIVWIVMLTMVIITMPTNTRIWISYAIQQSVMVTRKINIYWFFFNLRKKAENGLKRISCYRWQAAYLTYIIYVIERKKSLNLQHIIFFRLANYNKKIIFNSPFCFRFKFDVGENSAQNGSSTVNGNKTHRTENRYLNNTDSYKPSSLSGNLHVAATAPKITTFDQHSNPFVFKCELNLFHKFRVRKSKYLTRKIKRLFCKQVIYLAFYLRSDI